MPREQEDRRFSPTATPRTRRFARFLPKAPRAAPGLAYLLLLSVLLGLLGYGGDPLPELLFGILGVFFVPGLLATGLTPPVARALWGRFNFRRSLLLTLISLGLGLPFLIAWRLLALFLPAGEAPPLFAALLLAQGASLWFRHLSLFGMSNPHHGWSLPPALLQPVLTLLFLFARPPLPPVIDGLAAGLVLALGFLTSAALLHVTDRPMRREFGISGVALIRPLLEHVSSRDAAATRQLEGFFGRKAIEADLRLTVIAFNAGVRRLATIVLPTVHPGPFAAVGASDLPRKVAEAMGPENGLIFVPHTPCNHDLDLPDDAEVERVRIALRELAGSLTPSVHARVSPLVAPSPGAIARAQAVGDAVLAVITQAPATSDDIDYAIVAPFYERTYAGLSPTVGFIDGHNSYFQDTGDITFASVAHRHLARDLPAAIELALGSAREGPLRAGVSVRGGYSVAEDGIGPEGIRCLVLEGAGQKTAYVLIDGNNLLIGWREKILEALRGHVEAAEVLTTDNHVVHEVDGGVNVVGERIAPGRLIQEIVSAVEEAVARLTPVTVAAGSRALPGVRVLGPGYTARLLTSLGDTISVFATSALLSFGLLVSAALLVVAVVR